jgi:indolepyruvate ferredoxin oxidoreductase beta subunit
MMEEIQALAPARMSRATERPVSIAIVAMGGQGGGVLTDWIVSLAEGQGWVAQSTSVPGVAQRTGATIYYVEMMPSLNGRKPVLAQMATPGDVDVVMASEYIEAGRSILRGFVTPDRTTLIASTHRSLSIIEKIAPGDGRADDGAVFEAINFAARNQIVFDMDSLAVQHGSVISAALFGALAACARLPFDRAAFVDIIRRAGKGVDASIATFNDAFEEAKRQSQPNSKPPFRSSQSPALPGGKHRKSPPAFDGVPSSLAAVVRDALPPDSHGMALTGLAKVVDYQDVAYGREYLALLQRVQSCDAQVGGAERGHLLTVTAAKYIANAMTYDDVIRVADLKTRSTRRRRIETELRVGKGHILHTTEFMHPRAEEMTGLLPAPIGRWIMARPRLLASLDRRFSKGRRLRAYSLGPFLLLYIMGGLRWLRRYSLRHAEEVAHRDRWLESALRHARHNYALAVEVLSFRRLVKGYSDTHSRSLSKFGRAMAAIDLIDHRADAADWARRLREAALEDPDGEALEALIQTMKGLP